MTMAAAAKIKEIKQRQQNWLKQRDSAIKAGEKAVSEPQKQAANTNSKVSQHKPEPGTGRHHNASFHSSTTPSKKISTVDKINQDTRPKAKFHQWLAAKNKEPNDDHEGTNRAEFSADQCTKEQSALGKGTYNASNYGGWTEDTAEVHNVNRASPNLEMSSLLSADQFDTVADAIVRKVKDQLRISTSDTGQIIKSDNKMHVTKSPGDEHQLCNSAGASSRSSSRESTTNNHACPDCQHIMIGPDHCPMLVVPCGHSLCSMCSEQCDLCPLCSCEISGITQNIMLEQIIAKFHHDQVSQGKSTHSKPSPPSPFSSEQKTAITEDLNYEEEYQSLCLRCEVLQAESANIETNISSLNLQTEQTNRQIANIEGQQERLQIQIREIQKNIQSLEQHKEEYIFQRDELNKKMEKERSKLHMVQETEKTLQAEAQKMKYLAAHTKVK